MCWEHEVAGWFDLEYSYSVANQWVQNDKQSTLYTKKRKYSRRFLNLQLGRLDIPTKCTCTCTRERELKTLNNTSQLECRQRNALQGGKYTKAGHGTHVHSADDNVWNPFEPTFRLELWTGLLEVPDESSDGLNRILNWEIRPDVDGMDNLLRGLFICWACDST